MQIISKRFSTPDLLQIPYRPRVSFQEVYYKVEWVIRSSVRIFDVRDLTRKELK